MEITVSPELGTILGFARDEAMRTGHFGIGADHLMLGLLRHSDNDACMVLRSLGVDLKSVKTRIDDAIFRDEPVPYSDEGRTGLTRSAHNVLSITVYEALKCGQSSARPEHLLLALSLSERTAVRGILDSLGLTREVLAERMRSAGLLRQMPDPVLPKAEEIARALEDELKRVINIIPMPSTDFYS